MRRLKMELSNRRGITLILSMLLILVFIGAAAFAVDVGHANLNRAEVHAAADAAALAGIEKYAVTVDSVQALAEAKLFATKFNADRSALALQDSDFALGHCSAPCSPGTFSAGAPDTVAKATIRTTTHYAFAQIFTLLGLDAESRLTSATSIAVGGAGNKSVTKSGCVAPITLGLSAVFNQLGEAKGNTDSLTASDIAKLRGTPAKTLTLTVQNGAPPQVHNPGATDFYQAEFPPLMRADGSIPPGTPSNSAAMFRSAFTCNDTLGQNIGVGDWLGAVNGTKANQTSDGATAAAGGPIPPPVTLEVALTGNVSTPIVPATGLPLSGCPCFQVLYLGAFTVTGFPSNKEMTGYFTALSPPGGGIIASDTLKSKPLGVISKIRLIY